MTHPDRPPCSSSLPSHRPPPNPTRKSPRAFTLIELLVVVSIIALLIALLLPALGQAREKSKGVACAANLHGLYLATVVYSGDSNGIICPSYLTIPNATADCYWWYCGKVKNAIDPTSGLLSQYIKNTKILLCPSIVGMSYQTAVTMAAIAPSTVSGPICGYSSNAYYINGSTPGLTPPQYSYNITQPVVTVLFQDDVVVNNNTSPTLLYNCIKSNQNIAPGNLHGRHNGMANVMWFDGHADQPTLYKPNGMPASLQKIASDYSLGFLYQGSGSTPYSTFTSNPQKNFYYWLNKDAQK